MSYMGKVMSKEGRAFVGFEARQMQTHSEWEHTTVCWNNIYCISLFLSFYYISSIRELMGEKEVSRITVSRERLNCIQTVLYYINI